MSQQQQPGLPKVSNDLQQKSNAITNSNNIAVGGGAVDANGCVLDPTQHTDSSQQQGKICVHMILG